MAKTRRCALRTYTLEEKVALVTRIDRLYRAGGISLNAAAEAAGTTGTSYNNWLRAGIRPQPEEPAPSRHPAAPRPYEPAERERLVAEVERLRATGLTVPDACRAAGISIKSYRRWSATARFDPAMRPVSVTALVPVAPAEPRALILAPPRPASAPEGLTLVAPGGYRIEGLGIESAAQLLRALA
jgi:transposase-like protein